MDKGMLSRLENGKLLNPTLSDALALRRGDRRTEPSSKRELTETG